MSDADQGGSVLDRGAKCIKECTRFSGQSRTSIYAAMADGTLPYFVKGGRRFIATRDLVAWMERILKRPT